MLDALLDPHWRSKGMSGAVTLLRHIFRKVHLVVLVDEMIYSSKYVSEPPNDHPPLPLSSAEPLFGRQLRPGLVLLPMACVNLLGKER